MSRPTTTTTTAAAATAAAAARTRRRRVVGIVSGLAVTAGGLLAAGLVVSGPASAGVVVNCQAAPSTCGFPDATSSGVPASVTLKAVPAQVSSGPGWSYNASTQTVNVTGNGAVLSGLSISGTLNIAASNVVINHDQVVSDGGSYGISLRHTDSVTVENSTIRGTNVTTGRVNSAVGDLYGDSTGLTVAGNNISWFRSAIQVTTGQVTGNYIHDPGYVAGDHTNGVIANGGTGQLTISHNTILISLGQTDAISLDTSNVDGPVTNKVITGNLLAGGSYSIYGGTANGHTTAGIRIENNRFGQAYYTKSGQYGPVAYAAPTGTNGNTWTGNIWDTTATTIPAP
jgi:hypothetical protein